MFRVDFGIAAAKSFKALSPTDRARVRLRVRAFAGGLPHGCVNHAVVRFLRHADGSFVRLRVGHWLVMCDVLELQKVVLVLGIVSRRDLRWTALGRAGSWRLAVLGRGSASSLIDE